MRILLAGGAVRDMLLGRGVADADWLVVGTDEAGFLARFPEAKKVGKSFPVFWLHHAEYAFPRVPADDPETAIDRDLAARDLTVNALALDADGRLYAHPQALGDLRNRVLRPASAEAFRQDPLRVFRAARFAARLPDFSPHPDLLAAMAGARDLLPGLPAERVGRELRKALAGEKPSRFLKLLARTGCLSPWLAELEGADAVPAGPEPFHTGPVLAHLGEVVDRLAGHELRGFMGLAHDLGKVLTPAQEWPRHHGHDKAGEAPAEALGRRLALPNEFIRAGKLAAGLHMKASRYGELRPGTRVDVLTAVHAAGILEDFFAVLAADGAEDFTDRARADLSVILAVRLRPEDRDLGEKSGEKLRTLRAMALKRAGGA